jgi:hypothetical protein
MKQRNEHVVKIQGAAKSQQVPSRAVFATCFMLVPRLAYSSKQKMEVKCSPET